MVLLTMIARVSDGLPLAASVQDDEMVCLVPLPPAMTHLPFVLSCFLFLQQGRSYLEYQNQAKMLFRKLHLQSPNQLSIESGPYYFQ